MPIPYKLPPTSPSGPSGQPEKKKRKPRQKRRFQSLAEKAAKPELYKWTELLGSYQFNPDEHVSASLTESEGTWDMILVVDGQRFVGKRPTLEDAFKALSDLMFKTAKKYWLKQDAHVVMLPWMMELPV